MHRRRYDGDTIRTALALVEEGRSHREAATAAGLPVETLRTWLYRRTPAAADFVACDSCGAPRHDFASLPAEPYAYLLAQYLGDGSLQSHGRGVHSLRITLDTAYPSIILTAGDAIERIRGRRPHERWKPDGRNCVVLTSYWKQWPCLLPQHGPGRKHRREIRLLEWQQRLVDRAPEAFLRGLIHTDGWRGVNRVRSKGRDYAYPRYQFSNRSDDIRRLFTDTCDKLGIAWRPWGRWHISVARRDAVAAMDAFIGPKA